MKRKFSPLIIAGTASLLLTACSDDPVTTYCGTATSDGVFNPSVNTVLVSGTYNFDSFTIPAGVTVTGIGSEPIMVIANSVLIEGTLDVSGLTGADSDIGSPPHGGDAGPGGGGGGGGGDCTANGGGNGGSPNGVSVLDGDTDGGSGGAAFGSSAMVATAGEFGPGGGGGGGGSALAGSNGDDSGSGGGFSMGGVAYSDAMMSLFTGGAGGAGGGADGGGGGGGGGAIKFIALSIDVPGSIIADGGAGGGKLDDSIGGCTSGSGGGGAGGMIWLASETMTVSGSITALGGVPAVLNGTVGLDQFGGPGSEGRVQLTASVTSDTTGATLTPAPLTSADTPACP